jgi:hypothetical protein
LESDEIRIEEQGDFSHASLVFILKKVWITGDSFYSRGYGVHRFKA